ncbi:MAG: HlyC/CorC family transporter [Clostridia bacterium]|nr:HlyC/CorC family transporter [Clostridia bacterium]
MSEALPSIVSMAICILLSAFFSAAETSYSSLNKTKVRTLAEKGHRRAIAALALSERYDELISSILIGNNVVNIATASIGTVLFVRLYGDIGATVSTVVVTLLVLVFGEVSPKSIAKDCPEKFAMLAAAPLHLVVRLLTPFNCLFTLWKRLLSRLLRLEIDNRMSQEELLMLVDEVQQDGSIDSNEGELLKNAIEFTEREAEDILTHRVDLEAIPVSATRAEVAELFSRTKYSRIPVYDGSIDNIIGVIHQKDFYADGAEERPLSALVAPAVFVLKTEKISALLRKLQKIKAHVAIVLDEYGGTYGLVTMEDILEELVGEIWDEHDEVTEYFRPVAPGLWRVDGAVDLDRFIEHFGLKRLESDMVSLSGWVMEQLAGIPAVGDHFVFDRLDITVSAVAFHRVAEVEVRLPDAGDGADGASEN